MATGILFNIDRKVEKVAEHSLVSDSEISKLSLYPAYDGEEGLDARISAIESSIGDGTGDSLSARMSAAEGALETLNGDATTAGSVAKAVADAKATIDAYTVNGYAISTSPVLNGQDIALTGFTPEATSALSGITASSNVSAAIDSIDAVLAIVTGASSVTGSIAKAEADAKAYTDEKVSALGSVFSYKGTKATLADLQAVVTGNKVGDVWTVTNASGAAADQNLEYVCVAVNATTGAGTWERLGTNVDLSGYYTKVEVQAFTVNGKAVYTNPTLNGSDIALGSGFEAVSGSVLTGIATGSTIDAAFDKVDEVLGAHDAAINLLNGNDSTAGSVAYAVKAEETARKEELLKYTVDYTAVEVYPTDEEIAAGTVDDVTGLTYKNAVPACMEAVFKLRTTCPVAESDVVVDWGDNNRTYIKDVPVADVEQDGNEYNAFVRHTYTNPGRYIVKFFGTKYFGFGNPGVRSLVSRAFASDLPFAKHLNTTGNLAAFSDRLLKIDIPSYVLSEGLWNLSGMFQENSNLISATGLRYLQGDVRNCKQFFYKDESLETTDFVFPAYVRDGFIETAFFNCKSLAIDIASVFPKQGFIGNDTYTVNYMFVNCKALSGTVPAAKLWENTNITWINTSTAFSGCSPEIRAQVPTSWGGTNTEIQAKLDAGYYNKVIKNDVVVVDQKFSNKLSYEFINSTTSKDLEDKMYIVRGAKFVGTLPTGNAINSNIAIRIIVNEAAAALDGEIKLASGSSDTINGVSTPFALDDIMDVIFIYDPTNHDWVPVETRI